MSRIEELNLSGNNLTASSLRHLGRAMSVCPDLRDLDISNNNIKIATLAEMKEWMNFMEGFARLKCVRRLDMSYNPLGDFAVEIIFRAYAMEQDIFIPYDFNGTGKVDCLDESTDVNYSVEGFDIRSQGGHLYLASHSVQAVDVENNTDGARKVSNGTISIQSSGLLSSSPTSSLDLARDPAEIHGLRGIPYLVMSNIDATDLSAMWLSYIIPEHPLPLELNPHLPPLKEGPLATTLRKYDSLQSFRGIILTENPTITALGHRVLKEAEERRDEDAARVEELLTNGQGRRRSSAVSDMGFDDIGRRDQNRRNSIQDDSTFGSFSPKNKKLFNDARYSLERTRAKIQLNVLKEQGVGASLLWKKVMRIVVVSRAIMLDFTGPIIIDGFEPTLKIEKKNSVRYSLDSNFKTPLDISPQCSPTSKEPLSDQMRELALTPGSSKSEQSRGPALPGNLPIDLWLKIILLAEDSDNLTTRTQRLNIFHWARSRASIANELEHLSESTESQTRRVIARVKGLTYEL
ncbi:hypothetical protein ABW20_dc0105583 [Dactylellina cionopaga]|nr:hypothetical protein ABW20_dc0105583 [Dactylellina cionopaga]